MAGQDKEPVYKHPQVAVYLEILPDCSKCIGQNMVLTSCFGSESATKPCETNPKYGNYILK